jgi:predicted aconitase with swiveling domain
MKGRLPSDIQFARHERITAPGCCTADIPLGGGKAYAESETGNVVLIKEMMLSNFHAFKKEKGRKGRTSLMRG